MGLPSIVTPSLLASIRSRPSLPPNVWYFVASVTLSILNRPDEIPHIFHYAIEKDAGCYSFETSKDRDLEKYNRQLQIARRLREALIKAAPIGGLPKTINALLSLKAKTPVTLLDESLGYSPSARSSEIYDTPSSQIMHRGQKFFDQVYGKVSQRVMGQMDRSGTEDLGLTARLLYGYILSNTNILSAAESSFVLIAGIIPQDVSIKNGAYQI